MTATENVYQELLSAAVSCNTLKDVENMVKQILNIDEKHLFFDQIVDKICQRADIGCGSLVEAEEVIVDYLTKLERKSIIRAFEGDGTGNLEHAAIEIVSYYENFEKLPMVRFKKIMVENGYVVGPAFKSTRIMTNQIAKLI